MARRFSLKVGKIFHDILSIFLKIKTEQQKQLRNLMIQQDQFYLKQMTTLSSLLMTFTFATLGCRHKPSNLKGLSSCISVALCNFSIHDYT